MIQQVSAAIIVQDNHLLISRRQHHQSMSDYWELPGGKCEANELPVNALKREIKEEVGLNITEQTLAYSTIHHYDHGTIQLHVYHVITFLGQAHGQEGQMIHWLPLNNINTPPHRMLPAGIQRLVKFVQSMTTS